MTPSPAAKGSPYRRILCATDGSVAARHAASQAVALAERLGAELLVLYVVVADFQLGIHLQEELREERAAGQAAVREITAEAERLGVPVRTLLVVGDAGPTIVETAEREGADLIVVGRHGQDFLERVLLGSVASYVSQHSRVAVLLVPAP